MLALVDRMPPPSLTPREIAQSVEKSLDHKAMDERLAKLSSRRQALLKKQAELLVVDETKRPIGHVEQIANEIARARAEMAALVGQLSEMRQAHARRVAAALAPARREAAKRLLSTMNALREAAAADAAILNETSALIEQAGLLHRAVRIPPLDFAAFNARLRSVVEGTGELI